jgi:phosphate transport system protein
MKHTENELLSLKADVCRMWQLVRSQLENARQAYLDNDLSLAGEVIEREQEVNACELRIDRNCENYIALYNPVAVDLRLVLSLLRICSALERIADFAESIARHVIEEHCEPFPPEILNGLRIKTMFDTVIEMLSESYEALEAENTGRAGKILSEDETVDEIYVQAIKFLARAVHDQTIGAECGLHTLLVMRKIERIGDHCSNLVEEIVFYIDAKVLKHNKNSLSLPIKTK